MVFLKGRLGWGLFKWSAVSAAASRSRDIDKARPAAAKPADLDPDLDGAFRPDFDSASPIGRVFTCERPRDTKYSTGMSTASTKQQQQQQQHQRACSSVPVKTTATFAAKF
ncbi:hypothetical protein ElyMa_006147200 [Elysia marginata]|uniref:AGC-kinase C-terminal domain-containing protein n=1 Tax=Elysia marginata TaxID=1093978 RepID=A0AAV4GY28_9GAST|nr:hypothetical protein ElyMa_006147200 [Elysia marginata]